MAGYLVANQLAGGPLGAWLFVVAAALPFGFDAASFVVAAVLVAALRPRPAVAAAPGQPRPLCADIAEGVRWLWRQPTLRLLAVCLGLMNLTGAGTFAIWVLWARERLGVRGVGFGVLVTAYAAGGLLGTTLAGRLEARLGAAVLLRAGLVVEALCQLSLALTRRPWVAGVTLVLFGAHAMVWGGGDGVAAAAGRARPAARAGQQRVLPLRPRRGRARHAGRRAAGPGARHHRTVLAGVRGHGAARGGGVAALRTRSAARPGRLARCRSERLEVLEWRFERRVGQA
jgi:Transmembrane secretion effector